MYHSKFIFLKNNIAYIVDQKQYSLYSLKHNWDNYYIVYYRNYIQNHNKIYNYRASCDTNLISFLISTCQLLLCWPKSITNQIIAKLSWIVNQSNERFGFYILKKWNVYCTQFNRCKPFGSISPIKYCIPNSYFILNNQANKLIMWCVFHLYIS